MSDGDGARVAVFVTAIGSEHCEQVFQMLMEDKLRTNGNFMPQAWEALFGVAPDDATRAKWLEQMVSHASKVLDRMSDIKQWIPERNLSEFLGKLIDVVYFQILQLMQNLFGEVRGNTVEIEQDRDDLYGLSDRLNRATLEKYLEAMEKLSNVSPPQILETYDVIEYRMKQFGFGESAFLLELEAKRQLLIQERSFKQTAEATIDSWIW
jgi:transcriptional regulator of heat shock response